ncbi:MAG: hypothetical protein JNL74_01440 [Fibrobacteres bacterium]|nr:hypothetical protein [Fibrobacterota bacterium]
MNNQTVTGEIVVQRIFDLGGTINMAKAREKLSHFADKSAVLPFRNAPDYLSFAHPLTMNLDSLKLVIKNHGGNAVTPMARLYGVGGLAISLRIPLSCPAVKDIQAVASEPLIINGRLTESMQVAEEIFLLIEKELAGLHDESFPEIVESERYRSFILTTVPGSAEQLMRTERNYVAALLISDPNGERLSQENVEDITRNRHSYYTDDLVVVDWDAALVVEPEGKYEDLLYLFEVANLELLLLRKYDMYLDKVLNKGYDEYELLLKGNPFMLRGSRDILAKLSEVRMDLAEVTDELDNVAKFFGDYYLARVFMSLSSKLHITEYHRTVDEKLATLNDLYRSIVDYQETRQNLILEWAIVLLIVFEIVMAFVDH